MCDCDCGGQWSWFEEQRRISRKERRCYECNRTILPGQRYVRTAGVLDREFTSYDICPRCDRIAKKLMEDDICVCYGGLLEALHCRNHERKQVRKWIADGTLPALPF